MYMLNQILNNSMFRPEKMIVYTSISVLIAKAMVKCKNYFDFN